MIEIINCPQNSDEWRAARCGLPTASEFHSLLAKGEGKTRRTYLMRLVGEIITGVPAETYESADMLRGRAMEPEARDEYAFRYGVEPIQVGFVRNDGKGCSPDSLLGTDGLLEIKTKKPELLAALIDRAVEDPSYYPPEHKAQCQGALWVCEREWIDLICYWPDMPMFTKRITRDNDYIANLAGEVDRFNDELQETVAKVRRYGGGIPRDLLMAG